MMILKNLIKYLAIFSMVLIAFSSQSQPRTQKEDFIKIAKYLTNGSGNWITPNPGYTQTNPESYKAFELRFSMDLNGNLLHLVHYSHKEDTSVITGESYWLWHPGEQVIKYYSLDIDGDFTDGQTFMESDGTFQTVVHRYNTNGNIDLRKDTNIIKSDDEHAVKSSIFRDGRWVSVAEYNLKKLN